MKILSVLRTLMLMPIGLLLTNESVCEIMQSTFRICFEVWFSYVLYKQLLCCVLRGVASRYPLSNSE